jgi:hypothetical protein
LNSDLEAQNIEITVKYRGDEMKLTFNEDLDIYEQCEKLKMILRFVTFDEELIKRGFGEEEERTSNEF